ncbi:hypothetical protein [Kordiimonas marina]|uniref:hypothetical protein n=1 Tax=Kordiimonas marina TaxID=2872312 RepID=UPI001FF61DB9|nr:hypothetical protein [Kordiimonas marina]MCJ9428532.1 hypothetical protein [Kordiimonas marina]
MSEKIKKLLAEAASPRQAQQVAYKPGFLDRYMNIYIMAIMLGTGIGMGIAGDHLYANSLERKPAPTSQVQKIELGIRNVHDAFGYDPDKVTIALLKHINEPTMLDIKVRDLEPAAVFINDLYLSGKRYDLMPGNDDCERVPGTVVCKPQ